MQGVIVKVEHQPGALNSPHSSTSSNPPDEDAEAAGSGRVPMPFLSDTLGLLPAADAETFSVQFNVDKVGWIDGTRVHMISCQISSWRFKY